MWALKRYCLVWVLPFGPVERLSSRNLVCCSRVCDTCSTDRWWWSRGNWRWKRQERPLWGKLACLFSRLDWLSPDLIHQCRQSSDSEYLLHFQLHLSWSPMQAQRHYPMKNRFPGAISLWLHNLPHNWPHPVKSTLDLWPNVACLWIRKTFGHPVQISWEQSQFQDWMALCRNSTIFQGSWSATPSWCPNHCILSKYWPDTSP